MDPDDHRPSQIPFGQIFCDDIFLLFLLGTTLPLLLYLVWGLLDIASTPVLPPAP